MTKNKTEETQQSVLEFLDAVPDEKKRSDGCKLVEIFQKETGFKPKMWGPSIIGFGSYIALDEVNREKYLSKFGKHKSSKGCIYVNKLSDIDEEVLREMIRTSVAYVSNLKLF